mmetsp:Transcript_22980/g.66285  ORF Transcript_22980/g.66285 Transcript_22980/m.66285 type:complete len:242 (-) Transcript_22980:55-780(-)
MPAGYQVAQVVPRMRPCVPRLRSGSPKHRSSGPTCRPNHGQTKIPPACRSQTTRRLRVCIDIPARAPPQSSPGVLLRMSLTSTLTTRMTRTRWLLLLRRHHLKRPGLRVLMALSLKCRLQSAWPKGQEAPEAVVVAGDVVSLRLGTRVQSRVQLPSTAQARRPLRLQQVAGALQKSRRSLPSTSVAATRCPSASESATGPTSWMPAVMLPQKLGRSMAGPRLRARHLRLPTISCRRLTLPG